MTVVVGEDVFAPGKMGPDQRRVAVEAKEDRIRKWTLCGASQTSVASVACWPSLGVLWMNPLTCPSLARNSGRGCMPVKSSRRSGWSISGTAAVATCWAFSGASGTHGRLGLATLVADLRKRGR